MRGRRTRGGSFAVRAIAWTSRASVVAAIGLAPGVPALQAHSQRAAGLDALESTPAASSEVSVAPATVPPGPRTVAVIMLNFASMPATPWTVDEARAAVFTGAASLNAFEREQSYGTISLTGKLRPDGDVFGWYTIDAPTATCDPDAWKGAADAKAVAAGVDLSGYQHHVYLFPKVSACSWSGTADMPGRDSFLNGTMTVRMLAHEFGHNLGAAHAGTLRCVDDAGVPVSFSASCTASEYGDPFDVMGTSARHASAFRKVAAGFIPASSVTTATRTGTYRIASSSVASTAVTSLRIPRGPGANYWHVEVRSPAGVFENVAATDPSVTGVTVRLAGEFTASATRLIDASPATATMLDAPWQPGQRFVDPVFGVAIAVQSVALGTAAVYVTVPGTERLDEPVAEPASASIATARATLRRVSAHRGVLRVVVPATDGARRCAIRVGGQPVPCRVRTGRVALVRTVTLGRRVLPVQVRIDGAVVLALRLRVPKAGASTHVVQDLAQREHGRPARSV